MTLKTRNFLIMLSFFIALPILGMIVLKFSSILVGLEAFSRLSLPRSRGLLQLIAARFFAPVPVASFASAIFICLVSAVCQILLYWFFEKTNVYEVFYLSIFMLSFSAEGLRPFLYQSSVENWPIGRVFFIGHVLVFARFLGVFAFLGASLTACNRDFRKHGRSGLIIFGLAFLISVGVPVDAYSWLSNGTPKIGFAIILFYTENILMAMACLSFMVAFYIREASEFRFLGLFALYIALGRDGLLYGDSYLPTAVGAVFLIVGLVYMIRRIHRYYLWM